MLQNSTLSVPESFDLVGEWFGWVCARWHAIYQRAGVAKGLGIDLSRIAALEEKLIPDD